MGVTSSVVQAEKITHGGTAVKDATGVRASCLLLPALSFLLAACSSGGGGTQDATTDPGGPLDAVPDLTADSPADLTGDAVGQDTGTDFVYGVPLAPDSPWPKFRRTADQSGRSPIKPSATGGQFWSFATGKGIFSSPVVAGDGTVYIGSADRTFYALTPDGTVRWKEETGEIIDSAALLDDLGRVYFGSGDGILRARDAASGVEIWDFHADDPAENGAFINWFEGNVAIGPDATLYVPNDNWFVYAVDRETGTMVWRFTTPDQTWSLPAVDSGGGNLYFGNNNLLSILGDNVFAVGKDGKKLWSTTFIGTLAASPVLGEDGLLALGGFDGFLHGLDSASGNVRFESPARDHIYASPALLSDGTVIQPGADGTVYALDPLTGKQKWAFDTLEPLRSSPAVDGYDRIYFGSGEGRLFVLEPDGSLRWSARLIDGDRNDLNASPALGTDAVYIAGESGEVFSVPYDWCLKGDSARNPACFTGGEDMPEDGPHLLYTSAMGMPMIIPPKSIYANNPLRFSLVVREKGDTILALIDSDTLSVTVTPEVPVDVTVSGDRRFLTIVPESGFEADAGGHMMLQFAGDWLVDPERVGLKMTGGKQGGTLDEAFEFAVEKGLADALPYPIPDGPGGAAALLHLYRLAAPLPTMLPSYNQIGFDSLHFVAGLVEGDGQHAVAWMMGAVPDGPGANPDPATRTLLPLQVEVRDGLITLSNEESFALEAMNVPLSFDQFRISAALDTTGEALAPAEVVVSSRCADIKMYGPFLQQLGLCNPQTDMLLVAGAILLVPSGEGVVQCPTTTAKIEFALATGGIEAIVKGGGLDPEDHRYALLAIDAGTGVPLPLDYGLDTVVESDEQGQLSRVFVKVSKDKLPATIRLHLLEDTCPLFTSELAGGRK